MTTAKGVPITRLCDKKVKEDGTTTRNNFIKLLLYCA